ncbi:MAG: GNAT family N-acetyltransferase [Spirochaetales bacterium]
MSFRLERISRSWAKRPFHCGKPSLDDYFKHYALKNDAAGISRAFVAIDEAENVVGYFTLSSGHVESPYWPESVRRGLGKYPLPVALIGKLAARDKGKGVGSWLLRQAFEKVILACGEVAIFAVIVDALDDEALGFYRHVGFHQFLDEPMRLFVTVAELVDAKARPEI